jgi:hypothetical protein
MKNVMITLILIFFMFPALAEEQIKGGFIRRMNFSLSMTSLSLSEQTNSGGSYSGTAINLAVEFPFVQAIKREYFIKSSVPIVSSSGEGLYSAIVGMNNYRDKLSAPYRLEDGASELKIRPKMQYYWGPHLGAGAAVYTLGTAKKSDFAFIVGAQAGAIKPLTAPWGLKFEGGLSKGFGINSGFLTYSVSAGATFDLD